MTYKMIKFLIQQGRTAGLRDKLGVLLLGRSITEEQYTELAGLLTEEA